MNAVMQLRQGIYVQQMYLDIFNGFWTILYFNKK